jgi:streptomycin 6-kinase
MKNTSLVTATSDDIPAINEIMRLSKGYWGYDDSFLNSYMKLLTIDQEYLVRNILKLLQHNGETIGFFSCLYEKGVFELHHLFVHPNYIGKGYGRILWNACCKIAAEMGVKEMIIWSDPHSEFFYIKMGCLKIGERVSPLVTNRYIPLMSYKIKK